MPIDSSGRGCQRWKSSKGKSKDKRKGDDDDGGVSGRQHKKAALVAEESSQLPPPPPPPPTLVSESETETESESESMPESPIIHHCGICGKDGHYTGFCPYQWDFPPEGKVVDTERYRVICENGHCVTDIEDGEHCCDCGPLSTKMVRLKPKYEPEITFLPFDPNRGSPTSFYSSDIEVLYSSSSSD